MQAVIPVKKIKSLAMQAAVLVAIVALSGCNTMQGAGKDIERAGEEIQEVAR